MPQQLLTIRVPETAITLLEEIADREGISRHHAARRMVDRFIESEAKQQSKTPVAVQATGV